MIGYPDEESEVEEANEEVAGEMEDTAVQEKGRQESQPVVSPCLRGNKSVLVDVRFQVKKCPRADGHDQC